MRKILGLLAIFLVLIAFVGCQSSDQNIMGEVKGFADPMTEEILISLNNRDFEAFSKNLGDDMRAQVNEELFNSQVLPMLDLIGEYQEGSKELLKAEKVDKNYIRAIYNSKYSHEEGNVIITIVFNTDEKNRKIEGFFMNSPKLQKM